MKAGCAAQKLQFEAHGKRDVVADFDGGRMTSDGGGLLLREANCCLGDLMARLGQCVSDFRQQEGRFYHGYYRERWPATRIRIRADAGFCRDGILSWCEANAVGYVLGLARRLRQFRYRTHSSWSRKRRVIGKAEHLRQGANPRFVVTNLELSEIQSPQRLYEQVYCARGEMENRIKEQQLCLFADRTSSATMRANQLRLYLSTFAYVLMNTVREVGLAGTAMAKAQCSTIRLKLFKIAAVIRITTRKVWLSLSSVHPFQHLYATALRNLRPPRMRRRWRAEPALSADRRLAAGVAPVRLRIPCIRAVSGPSCRTPVANSRQFASWLRLVRYAG